MPMTFVVPFDGSERSEMAIPYAVELARRCGGGVRVLRVMQSAIEGSSLPVSLQQTMRKRSQVELARAVGRHADGDIDVKGISKMGNVMDEITGAAVDASIVVMTTNGRTGLDRWVMGSVAEAVIRRVAVPVLIIRPPEKTSVAAARQGAGRILTDVLIPLDGSATADAALSVVPGLGREIRFHLLTVLSPGGPDPARVSSVLTAAAKRLTDGGHTVATATVEAPSPAKAIVDYAQKQGCSMIAMATHGRSGLSEIFLGSVTDRVLRTTGVPVLVVRPGRKLWAGGKRPLARVRK
ncbi:MAG: universal stress protein [Candidatus Brocadiae bacterium]|nr:universal stress protein [Candidatus Brocadiia bacterium]